MRFWIIKESETYPEPDIFVWEGGMSEKNANGLRHNDPRAWRKFICHLEKMVAECRTDG